MAEKTMTWRRRLMLYSSFSVFALVAAFFLTFPYDALKERIRLEADSAGFFVRIGSLGPGFFSIRAKNVDVSKKAVGDAVPESLRLDSVSVGPTLFPPGFGVWAKTFGGGVSARVSGVTTARLKIDVDQLDLKDGNVKGVTGVDLSGIIDAHVDLKVPIVRLPNAPIELDVAQASGTFGMTARNLTVHGGTVSIPIPQYGPEPTPLDLPRILFGDLDATLTFDKGAGTVDTFKMKSNDLEAQASGTLKLAKRLEYAEPNIELRFKPDPDFQKRLGLIGSALSIVGADPKDPTWRKGQLTGYLGRPAFR
ncbi:MAG: type II secretion system protein GspN [Archangium sp.]|nr:type II secretion system protein GspN [Archangium sp.]